MTNKEQIFNALERLGYKPQYDDDGDIMLRYQLKHIFFLTQDDDEEHFVSIILPQFDDFEEGEESLYLAACNKMTRETKMTKVYVDQTFKNISASCEFFYENDSTLEMNIKKALCILGVMRTAFRNCVSELSE